LLRRSLMGLALGKCERGYDNKRERCQPETSSHGHDCLLHDRGPSPITGGQPTGSRDKPRAYGDVNSMHCRSNSVTCVIRFVQVTPPSEVGTWPPGRRLHPAE
jgi:hypothetical protein